MTAEKRDWIMVRGSILNFEIVAAYLLRPDHRTLAWWMLFCAFSTLAGFFIKVKP